MIETNWQFGSSRRNVATLTMSAALAVTVSSPCATAWPVTAPLSPSAMACPSCCSVSSMSQSNTSSIHDEQPRTLGGVRTVRAVVVGHLVALPGGEAERAAVLEVGGHLAVEAEDDV